MTEQGDILLADDEDLFRDTTAAAFRAEGYGCDAVADAQQAHRLLAQRQYDLFVSDIRMPGNVELQFIEEVQRVAPGMPVVLVTGYPSVGTAVDAVRLPVVAYLVKPLDMGTLLPAVRQAIGQSKVYRAVRDARARFASQDRALRELEQSLLRPVAGSLPRLVETLMARTMQELADGLGGFRRVAELLLADSCRDRPSEARLLKNRLDEVLRTLEEAIVVLEQSKHSFKSKRLGELRRQIQALLHDASSGMARLEPAHLPTPKGDLYSHGRLDETHPV